MTDLCNVAVQNNTPSTGSTEDSQPITPVVINAATLSSTNPNGVLHIDTTAATAGETATITVTATDPTDHTTATRSFTVTVAAYNGPTNTVTSIGDDQHARRPSSSRSTSTRHDSPISPSHLPARVSARARNDQSVQSDHRHPGLHTEQRLTWS